MGLRSRLTALAKGAVKYHGAGSSPCDVNWACAARRLSSSFSEVTDPRYIRDFAIIGKH